MYIDFSYLYTYITNYSTGKTIEEYRRQLGSFGVSGDLALQTIASLSGGQKSRVAFARMCMGNPNFLVLDEPTNHLDIETIEALGKAIQKYTVSFGFIGRKTGKKGEWVGLVQINLIIRSPSFSFFFLFNITFSMNLKTSNLYYVVL